MCIRDSDKADKIGSKIRNTEIAKIPIMLILGEKEAKNNTVSIRRRFIGDEGELSVDKLIKNVSLEKTEPIVLKAGQVSLHHPTIIHGSGLNNSDDRRIGFVIQSYIGTNVNQVIGKMYVQKARGKDKFNYHEYSKTPTELMGKNEVTSQNKANEAVSYTHLTLPTN